MRILSDDQRLKTTQPIRALNHHGEDGTALGVVFLLILPVLNVQVVMVLTGSYD